jgi:oligo-1,6-glucosidase
MDKVKKAMSALSMGSKTKSRASWWTEAIVYQIYPASFFDSNGDGLGDLPGILSKIDYIASLGVTAIWLSPMYKSPQKDMGYDISDYRAIHEPYGSMKDMDRLISGLHKRGIKILLDLVVNHTSDKHAWFEESRSSRDSAKRDWYFWRDPKYVDGVRKEPNNWISMFGGSAWHWDEDTQQYYLGLFLPEQPDLNWTNKDMRRATYDDMQFWCKKGVDGFRIDSMNMMSKTEDMPDAEITDPTSEYQSGVKYFVNGPRMHEYIREMRREVFDKYDCMTVGELGHTKTVDGVAKYVASDRKELNCVFTGDVVDLDFGPNSKYEHGKFELSELKRITEQWQTAMPKFDGWNTVYMDNHDSGRALSRYTSDHPVYRARAAKMLATYMCTLSGNLFLLQGQEIGMANVPRNWGIDSYIDVEGLNWYNRVLKERGEGANMSDVMRELRVKARDNGRLPVQWDDSENAGFTAPGSKPWMRVNDDYKEWNVKSQVDDKKSVLSYWKSMLQLRKAHKDVFIYGTFKIMPDENLGDLVFAYTMTNQDQSKMALVVLNFSENEKVFEGAKEGWRKLAGEAEYTSKEGHDRLALEPYEGVVYCDW